MERLARRLAISSGFWRDGSVLVNCLANGGRRNRIPAPSLSLPLIYLHLSSMPPICLSCLPLPSIGYPTNLFQHSDNDSSPSQAHSFVGDRTLVHSRTIQLHQSRSQCCVKERRRAPFVCLVAVVSIERSLQCCLTAFVE